MYWYIIFSSQLTEEEAGHLAPSADEQRRRGLAQHPSQPAALCFRRLLGGGGEGGGEQEHVVHCHGEHEEGNHLGRSKSNTDKYICFSGYSSTLMKLMNLRNKNRTNTIIIKVNCMLIIRKKTYTLISTIYVSVRNGKGGFVCCNRDTAET